MALYKARVKQIFSTTFNIQAESEEEAKTVALRYTEDWVHISGNELNHETICEIEYTEAPQPCLKCKCLNCIHCDLNLEITDNIYGDPCQPSCKQCRMNGFREHTGICVRYRPV